MVSSSLLSSIITLHNDLSGVQEMHHVEKLYTKKQTGQSGGYVVYSLSSGAFLVHYKEIIVFCFYPIAFVHLNHEIMQNYLENRQILLGKPKVVNNGNCYMFRMCF